LPIERVLELVNEDLWAGATEASEIDFLACAADAGGRLSVGGAGRAFVLRASPGAEPYRLNLGGPPLGIDLEIPFASEEFLTTPGEIVVVSGDDRPLDQIVEAWRAEPRSTTELRSARDAVAAVDRVLRKASAAGSPLLILRRTR
jgi:hypothetical protein